MAKKGDIVKIRLTNNSTDVDHPMHLHGHFFQVLSKNGKPLEGSPIIKDTIPRHLNTHVNQKAQD